MNSIQKGSMTVIVSTVIASAAILMTGKSVADGNKAEQEGVKTSVNSDGKNVVTASSEKEDNLSVSANTPPPPSGPFLGVAENAMEGTKDALSSNVSSGLKQLPSAMMQIPQNIMEKPKAPEQPSAPSVPAVTKSTEVPQGTSAPKASAISKNIEIQAEKPVKPTVSEINQMGSSKNVTPAVPKTPEAPVVSLNKPAKIAKEVAKPLSPEKANGVFKPSSPEIEMTSKPALKEPSAPVIDKEISAPRVSSEIPKLQKPGIVKPQLNAPEIKRPSVPIRFEDVKNKSPNMPQLGMNAKRLVPPLNVNQGQRRPVMPRNMGHPGMRQQHLQQGNEQANNRIPLWKEKMWQQNSPRSQRGNPNYNQLQKGNSQTTQKTIQGKMAPPTGMYQYAPMYPSNYGYPQMPMWNGYNNGYYYQMMPYYWPVMPRVMPNSGMPKQGGNPPVKVQKKIDTSSVNEKK